MPDSPADVKTQSRSTPPSMPPPPPAVTQGATRHPSFTPNTSEYPGRGWGRDARQGGFASLRLQVTRCSRGQQHPQTCMVLAVLWGGVTRPCAGECLWAAHPGSCMCMWGAQWHCPSPAVPSKVLGDVDILVSCQSQSSAWPRVLSPAERWMEDAVGWSWSCCGSCPHVAPSNGRALFQPAAVAGMAW